MKITHEAFEAIIDARNSTKAFYELSGADSYGLMIEKEQEVILHVCKEREVGHFDATMSIARENNLQGGDCSKLFAAYIELRLAAK